MWSNLMATQEILERKIREVHHLDTKFIQEEMMMALRDEVMEYAKTTRCFKVWSFKAADHFDDRIEEFSDGIHLYLGRAVDLGLDVQDIKDAAQEGDEISKDYKRRDSKKQVLTLLLSKSMDHLKTPMSYTDIKYQHEDILMSFTYFMAAGRVDGFSDRDIEQGYYLKNRINLERLKSGY
jgi:dimeric dUTPase (all-alpha-NTP-PPase superfamily)